MPRSTGRAELQPNRFHSCCYPVPKVVPLRWPSLGNFKFDRRLTWPNFACRGQAGVPSWECIWLASIVPLQFVYCDVLVPPRLPEDVSILVSSNQCVCLEASHERQAKLTCNRSIGCTFLQAQFSLCLKMKTFSRVAKFHSWSAKPDSNKVLWRGEILNSIPPKCAFARFLIQVILWSFATCKRMFSPSSPASQERQTKSSCSREIWHKFLQAHFSLAQKWKPFHK